MVAFFPVRMATFFGIGMTVFVPVRMVDLFPVFWCYVEHRSSTLATTRRVSLRVRVPRGETKVADLSHKQKVSSIVPV